MLSSRSNYLSFLLILMTVLLAACGGEVQSIALLHVLNVDSEKTIQGSVENDDDFAGIIRLGATISESGIYADEGSDVRQGYDLWADWVNNEYGGIRVGDKHYQVEIIYYDNKSDPDTGVSLTERLIIEDEVDFLLGPYSSSMSVSASAVAEKHNIIMVEGNGSSETFFEHELENLFTILTPANNYTQSALETLAEQGAKTVVIAYEDTAFPTSVGQGAEMWARAYGMEVLAVEIYPKGVSNFSTIMAKFRDLDPDVFVGGGHFNDAPLFVNAAQEVGFTPAMVLAVGPSNPQFIEEVGDNHIRGSYFGTASEYGDRYENMWGELPTYQAAESTVAALALQVAIEQAGSLNMNMVRQALKDLSIVTFYGPIHFDKIVHHRTAKPIEG